MGLRNDNGRYTLCGGHADPGESPKRCALREMLEETSLIPDSLEPIKQYQIGPTKLSFFKATTSDKATGMFDPDQECEEWYWVPVPLPSNVVENLHGPTPDQNPLKELVGYSQQPFPLHKAELVGPKILAKMAIADLKPGKEIKLAGQRPEQKSFDYNHLLPQHLKDQGYKLYVQEAPDRTLPGAPPRISAVIHHPSYGIQEDARKYDTPYPAIAATHAALYRDKSVNVMNTIIPNQAHRSKGLGLAMYEALFAHAKHLHGTTHVSSPTPHSTMAMRVHKRLAEKHGLAYKPVPRFGGEPSENATNHYENRLEWMKAGDPKNLKPYDDRFAGYRYALKCEETFTPMDLFKALTDIKAGNSRPGTGPDTTVQTKEFDYTHHLPKHLRQQGFKLKVQHTPLEDGEHQLIASVHHPSASGVGGLKRGQAGVVELKVRPRWIGTERNQTVGIDNSYAQPEFQGKGLGLAMYEAGLAHAANQLGATHAYSDDEVSSMANRVHQAIARKHGLNYQPKKNIPSAAYPTEWMWENNHKDPTNPGNLEYDARYHGYHYAIKSEAGYIGDPLPEYELPDDVGKMLQHPDPRERALALKMEGVEPRHLIEALKDRGLHGAIMAHPAMNGQVLDAIFADPSHKHLWHDALSHINAGAQHLHAILDTGHAPDLWEGIAGDHELADPTIHNRLLDHGHWKHLATTPNKDQVKEFVQWHLEDPSNPGVFEAACYAFKNPVCPESLLDEAMSSNQKPSTQLAALQNKTYLSPKAEDYITGGKVGFPNPDVRVAILRHPKCPEEWALTAINDKDPMVANAARQKAGV